MQNWMLNFVNAYGYVGIFLLIFIENVFPPIPSEAVLLFGGALTVSTAMNLPLTVTAATAGSLAGAIVLYGVGRALGAERLTRLLDGKLGKVLHLHSQDVAKAQNWFSKYQSRAVLVCRCIPLVRSLISIPAGFSKMPLVPFLLLTALGSAVWNTILTACGAALGTAWETAMPYFDQYTHWAVIFMAVAAAGAAIIYVLHGTRRKGKNQQVN